MLFKLAITPLKTNTFREGGQPQGVSQKTCRLSLKRSFRDKSWRSLIYTIRCTDLILEVFK